MLLWGLSQIADGDFEWTRLCNMSVVQAEGAFSKSGQVILGVDHSLWYWRWYCWSHFLLG